jgi:hypothetical protein
MATDTLDSDIYSLIGYYGFKRVHSRLVEIMKDEYTYLHSQFQPIPIASNLPLPAVQMPIETKKVRKPRSKKIVESVSKNTDTISVIPENIFTSEELPEIKEVVLVPPQDKSGYRDPKEWKEYQKKAEEAKHRENEALGIQIYTILTKENLKKWVEEEGQSYAWVAREKAGCPDTQVAATAQMMGIRSKVTKKRGMILSGK